MAVERPDIVSDGYLKYLDDLQESSVTNMHGAGSYLTGRFSLSRNEAREVLQYWMDSYEERHPA